MDNKENIIQKVPIDASILDITTNSFFVKEKRYLLTPLEHRILSESETKLRKWSERFFLISIGLALTIISKTISFLIKFSNTDTSGRQTISINIENWEFIYLVSSILLSIILWLLSCTKLDNSDRKKLMKKIKSYFDGN